MSDPSGSGTGAAGSLNPTPSFGTVPQLAESALRARILNKLNYENIKLWTEPFIIEGSTTTNDHEILALASRYSTELGVPESDLVDCLFNLQRNAMERLAERELYQQTGLATIRIRFSGFSTDNIKSGNTARLQINLQTMLGRELKKTVGDLISVNPNRLKLISTGRVVDDNVILEQQNIRNGTQVMVLSVSSDHEAHQQDEEQFRQLEETKGAADYLAGRNVEEMYSLQVADQHGKTLDLPPAEKKALAIGLALHEKGRRAMKNGEFSKALVFLLEADNVYSQCQSKILENVDNFGMLNLDIAWCYLNLQSISELPQTEQRLLQCEQALHRSYGENMERLINLKGSSGWEAALYVRLHLLQGIAAYHQGQIVKSNFFITQAESELNRLRVSDGQLAELMNMGYSADEARMALRSTYSDIQASVDWIIRMRQERLRIRNEEAEKIRLRKLQKRLGVCDNGDPINATLFKSMQEMGYPPQLITPALKRTNNDINSALQLVSDPTFISSVIPSHSAAAGGQSSFGPSTSSGGTGSSSSAAGGAGNNINNPPGAENPNFTNFLIEQLRELLATMDGSNFPGDLEEILTEAQSIPDSPAAEIPERFRSFIENMLQGNSGIEFSSRLHNILSAHPNLSNALQNFLEDTIPEGPLSTEERERSEKAYNALSEDLGTEAEYIDLALSAESMYLEQYKGLLQI